MFSSFNPEWRVLFVRRRDTSEVTTHKAASMHYALTEFGVGELQKGCLLHLIDRQRPPVLILTMPKVGGLDNVLETEAGLADIVVLEEENIEDILAAEKYAIKNNCLFFMGGDPSKMPLKPNEVEKEK